MLLGAEWFMKFIGPKMVRARPLERVSHASSVVRRSQIGMAQFSKTDAATVEPVGVRVSVERGDLNIQGAFA